jgi:hypothetical protein
MGGSNGNGDDRNNELGGGGNGGYVSPVEQLATSAIANRGSGGGGGAECSPDENPFKIGGSGGSGRVQIRYSEYYDPLTINSGSPDIIRFNGYRVYDFKGSGSFTI